MMSLPLERTSSRQIYKPRPVPACAGLAGAQPFPPTIELPPWVMVPMLEMPYPPAPTIEVPVMFQSRG